MFSTRNPRAHASSRGRLFHLEQALEAARRSLLIARELADAHDEGGDCLTRRSRPIVLALRATRIRCRNCVVRRRSSKGGFGRTDAHESPVIS
jgi:hypothetical protein